MIRLCAAAAVLVFVGSEARANSAPPSTYWVQETAPGTVRICPSVGKTCPDRVLLRRDVDGGAVVSMTACGTEATECYVDECVAAGTYQYGFEEPYACSRWGSYYYAQVEVAGASEGCTRTLPAPEPAASVPWTTTDLICRSTDDDTTGCSSAGGVVGLNLLVIAVGLALRRRRGA